MPIPTSLQQHHSGERYLQEFISHWMIRRLIRRAKARIARNKEVVQAIIWIRLKKWNLGSHLYLNLRRKAEKKKRGFWWYNYHRLKKKIRILKDLKNYREWMKKS